MKGRVNDARWLCLFFFLLSSPDRHLWVLGPIPSATGSTMVGPWPSVSTPHPTPHRGSPHPQIAVNSIETEDRGAKDGIVPYCKHFGLLCFTSWDLYPSTYHTLYPLMIKNGTQAAKLGCLMKRINHEPADVMCKLNNIGQAKNSVKSRGVSKILDQKIFWKNIMANYKFLFVFYYF